MAYPPYLREKARTLRAERHLSIVEIAERLALPKTTVFYWVRDLPLGRARRASPGQRRGNRRMVEAYRRQREDAYADGREEFGALAQEPAFRDFVCLYIAEGYKRSRNTVSLCNSDPGVVALALHWMRHFTSRPLAFAVQYHADQDPGRLAVFWSAVARYRARSYPDEVEVQQRAAWTSQLALRARRDGNQHTRHTLSRTAAGLDRLPSGGLVRLGPSGVWRSLVAHSPWARKVAGSNPATPIQMDRAKRYGLAALTAFIALNVWTGSPLLALWIGSQVQGEESQPSMGAFAAVIGSLALFSFLLYQALKYVSYAYRESTGTLPTVRSHAPWLRSMRGERPEYEGAKTRVSGPEQIVVVCVIVAALAFEIWFFFLSGSSIGGGSGR